MKKWIIMLPLLLLGQSMTVYKDNIALVKTPIYWSVQSGLSEITYDQLPGGLFPESPFLRSMMPLFTTSVIIIMSSTAINISAINWDSLSILKYIMKKSTKEHLSKRRGKIFHFGLVKTF